MKKLAGALLLCASTAFAQTNGWAEIQNGWGEIQTALGSYSTMPAPGGCTSGLVPYFNASLQLVCSPTVYAPATDTTTATGTIAARNLTATGLATPVITPPVSPVLSLLTTVTVVAGASLVDGDYFTLSDGSAVVYEFDSAPAGVTAGRVAIAFTGAESATAIRDLVIIAINGSTLGATAIAAAADTLTVTSDLAGDTMGVNSENVASAGFLVPAWSEPTHATTYGYKVIAYLPDGTSTAASAEVTTALGHATLSAANYNAVTWGNVTGAATYKLYRTTGGAAPPKLIYTGALLNFSDIGAAGTAETPATVNTTGTSTAGRVLVGDGAVGAPSIARSVAPTTGFYVASGLWRLGYSGVLAMTFGNGTFSIINTVTGWGATLFAANTDPGLSVNTTTGDTGIVHASTYTGKTPSTTPTETTYSGSAATGTDIPGGTTVVQSGAGTSDAAGSSIIFKTPTDSGSTGSVAQTQVARVTIKELHINLRLGDIAIYANNAAALAGGLVAGDLYRTGADPDPVMIVH